MQTYRDHEALIRLAHTEDVLGLHTLVRERIPAETASELTDWACLLHVVVMDCQDTPQALEQHLGFTVMYNRWNGLAWDHPDFTPSWDALEVYEHWYVLTFIQSDDGFGVVVFMPRGSLGSPYGTPNELSALCDRFAKEHPSP